MALGNSFSMGQSRGKAKPVLVKRTKEVYNARNYTKILSTARQGTSACALSVGSNEYYHDGSGDFPAVNDKVYSTKRAGTAYILEDGHYKMHRVGDERTTKNIEMSSGEVSRVTACP
tara:strand:+ start:728 stop:1078 length:351 start_codon:yes stop_codon:yes gene_type:complete